MHPHKQALLKALRSVPEVRLRLFELAWELVDDRGELLANQAASRAGELQDAIREAAAYAKAVKDLQWALQKLLPR